MPDSSSPHSLGRGKFLELLSVGGWEYVSRVRGKTPVGIIAMTADRRVLLISQFRVPIGADVIEIPAGLVGDHDGDENEDWELAAQRELLEETGYCADSMERLSEGPTSAGLTSERILLVRARGLTRQCEPQGDGDEQITLHEVPLDSADAWLGERIRAGTLIDPKVYAALYFLTRLTT